MRISTSQIFRNGIDAIQRQQSALARTQQQLSTGKRMLAPSDDPAGAGRSLQLRDQAASLQQYQRNADLASNQLSGEESALTQMGTDLQRIRELAVQGANATQSDQSRAAIAKEVRQLAESLLQTANTRDANGEYLFAGYRTASTPFVHNGTGEIEYLGDTGQRKVALSGTAQVAINDGGDAFMTIPRGNGRFLVTPADGNTGTATVSAADVLDPGTLDNASYDIVMVTDSTYEVRDSGGTVVTSGSYAPDQAIDFGGRRIVLTGTPAAGDTFQVTPAGTSSLFATVDRLASALETGGGDAAAQARLTQSVNQSISDLDQALGRVLELRTSVGARLDTVDSQNSSNADRLVQTQSALSAVEDLDYASAISRFQLQQTAIQAAQQTYVQMGHLSLFNYL